jgi:hypothetical protein
MGHQSYILLAKDEADMDRIIAVILEHNLKLSMITLEVCDDENYVFEVGEKLEQIGYSPLLKTTPKMFAPLNYTRAVLCGNGGGRSSTFNWFRKHQVCCVPYSGQKWISKKFTPINI